MQVQLKQTEIIAALKQFITSQGINLAGKEVNITFTAGRKEAGIIADVSIEDVAIPGFTDAEVEEAIKTADAPAPALSVVKPVPAAKPVTATEVVAAEPEVTASAEEPAASEAAATPAKTTSLFS